jgi:DNA-binding NarL/FixJ family response regulator
MGVAQGFSILRAMTAMTHRKTDRHAAKQTKLRFLLVDGHPLFLDSVASFLSRHPGIEIVGRAYSGDEAIALNKKTAPHLVLMDLAMPRINGLDAMKRIKAQDPATQVIILSLYDSPEWHALILNAGADGFIPKFEFVNRLPRLLGRIFPTDLFDASVLETSIAAN